MLFKKIIVYEKITLQVNRFEGHPDKVCDIISDSVVDDFLKRSRKFKSSDGNSVTTNKVVMAGVRGPENYS